MDIIYYDFFQRAILILLSASVVAGVIGSIIVIKKISMISGSIAHGAFGGLGIAYYLGLNPILGAISFSMIGATVIGYVSKRNRALLDSILSIFWAGGMSIGLLFLFLTPGYATDLFSYLFGNVLLSSSHDLFLLFSISIITVVSYILLNETLIATLFNEDFAQLRGIRVNRVFTFLLLMISLTVVVLIKTMGVVLTLAILTISPSIAIRYANRVQDIIVISILLNILSSVLGLFLAYYLDLPTAPVIILVQIVLFVVGIVVRK